MTQQTDRRPDTEISSQHRGARQPNRYRWLLVVLLAMAIAGIVGVAVTSDMTAPPTTPTVSHEPNANTREGRVPTPTSVEPNANTREGRVPRND